MPLIQYKLHVITMNLAKNNIHSAEWLLSISFVNNRLSTASRSFQAAVCVTLDYPLIVFHCHGPISHGFGKTYHNLAALFRQNYFLQLQIYFYHVNADSPSN
jgi:hypothetical protein